MKNFLILALGLSSSLSMASLYCDRSEFHYTDLIFKKDVGADSGFSVYIETTRGMEWLEAHEQFIAKRNGFRLKGIVEEGKVYEVCGEINSGSVAISKIAEQ